MLSNLFKKHPMQKNLGVQESVLNKRLDHIEELSDMEANSVVGGIDVEADVRTKRPEPLDINFGATAQELHSQSEFAINGKFRRG